jgi:hypothetical protein
MDSDPHSDSSGRQSDIGSENVRSERVLTQDRRTGQRLFVRYVKINICFSVKKIDFVVHRMC